jgi:hypothetical protein
MTDDDGYNFPQPEDVGETPPDPSEAWPTIIISFPVPSVPTVQIANANAFQVLLAAALMQRVADQVMTDHEDRLRQAMTSPIIRPGRQQ